MRTSAEYHAIAQGISDIYVQELTPPGGPPRFPEEGGWIELRDHGAHRLRRHDERIRPCVDQGAGD